MEWLARQIEEPAFQKARFRVCLIVQSRGAKKGLRWYVRVLSF
jgi:hypothetical protein